MDSGWVYLLNSKKEHYMVNGKSLCGRWMVLSEGGVVKRNPNKKTDCKTCLKKLTTIRN